MSFNEIAFWTFYIAFGFPVSYFGMSKLLKDTSRNTNSDYVVVGGAFISLWVIWPVAVIVMGLHKLGKSLVNRVEG